MGLCPRCNAEAKHIPAGTSKRTGKPYREFWSCSHCRDPKTGRNQTWVSERQWWYLHDYGPKSINRSPSDTRIHISQSKAERRDRGVEHISNIIHLPGNGKAPEPKLVTYTQPVTVDRFGNVLRKAETS